MTYQGDPNMRQRPGYREDETSYAGWIIGGVVALALLFGGVMLFSRDNGTIASNNASRPAATTTAPSTTGSGGDGNLGTATSSGR